MTFSIKEHAGKSAVSLLIFAFLAMLGPTANAQTLKTIKDRLILFCGVSQGIAGFSGRLPTRGVDGILMSIIAARLLLRSLAM